MNATSHTHERLEGGQHFVEDRLVTDNRI